ncbi:hypothetical protein Pelo_13409 [Pelomyxa schiedti]|nr:hypothetical protein Pelo_13409 [Pelomyxa schiedti]
MAATEATAAAPTATAAAPVVAVATTGTAQRTLIVYFSASGNTKKVVTELANQIGATPGHEVTTVELKDTKERTGAMGFFRSTFDTWSGSVTTLAPDDPSLADLGRYSTLVLAGPIWWYTLCTPVLTWVRNRRADLVAANKAGTLKIALLSTQGSNGHLKALAALKTELAGADVHADTVYNEKDIKNDAYKTHLTQWTSAQLFKA